MNSRKDEHSKGLLISFEGSEGSGKSTQIKMLRSHFETESYVVRETREPGGTQVGEEIRRLLKHVEYENPLCPETELLLFAAARAQLVREIINPALSRGEIILCDRYLDSTTVYQGVARQLANDHVRMINEFAVGSIFPDLTIVLDVPVDIGFQRVRERKNGFDRMEAETVEFFEKVRSGYLLLAQSIPNRIFVVDGTLDKTEIATIIWSEIKRRFNA